MESVLPDDDPGLAAVVGGSEDSSVDGTVVVVAVVVVGIVVAAAAVAVPWLIRRGPAGVGTAFHRDWPTGGTCLLGPGDVAAGVDNRPSLDCCCFKCVAPGGEDSIMSHP